MNYESAEKKWEIALDNLIEAAIAEDEETFFRSLPYGDVDPDEIGDDVMPKETARRLDQFIAGLVKKP